MQYLNDSSLPFPRGGTPGMVGVYIVLLPKTRENVCDPSAAKPSLLGLSFRNQQDHQLATNKFAFFHNPHYYTTLESMEFPQYL